MLKNIFPLVVLLLLQVQGIRAVDHSSSVRNERVVSLELLNPNEYETAKTFFVDFHINEPILYSVLENKSGGTIFTDNRTNPSFVVVHNFAGYTFLGGHFDPHSLREVASYLKTLLYVALVVPLDWKHRAFFEEEGFIPVERIRLQRSPDLLKIEFWKNSLSSSCSIENINAKNLGQCGWDSYIAKYYGGEERFYANGLGFCLFGEGKVISECYALLSSGLVEVGVRTNENYRGQNFGTIVSAFLLDYCYKNKLEPFWSCDVTNLASLGIAKKLGFEETGRYLFLKWISP